MKKIFLTTCVLLTGITAMYSQATSEMFQLGAKGGMNISNFSGDDFGDDVESRTSFHLGLVMEVPLSERFSLQPEVLYSGQGFTIESFDQDNVFDTDDNIEYQLDYIQLPVILKAYLIGGLSVEAGPSFNFKVNEEIDYQPADDSGDVPIDEEFSNIKTFDLGLAAGLSYKIGGHFFLSGRYNYGFTKIFKDSDADVRNSVWQFGAGFMF